MDDRYYKLLEKNLYELKNELKSDIKDIKEDIHALNTFKWKLGGAVSFIVFMFMGALEAVKIYFSNK